MKLHYERITGDSPHAQFTLPIYEFGTPELGPKIYLQAGMHADEHPGMLVLHHLMDLLEKAEKDGHLAAYFVLLPVVNPLGLTHISHHHHYGRYHLSNGLNYNRGWPDFAKILTAQDGLADALGQEAEANKAYVRDKIAKWLASASPITALDQQRHIVMSHCYDADMVLDLHCDDVALNHLYIVPQNLPRYQGLADRMQSQATLMAENSGGGSFDEVWTGLWIDLQAKFPDVAWPAPVLSTTLEYRGQADVFDDISSEDAQGLFDFFCDEGLIHLAPSTPLKPSVAPTDLAACEVLRVHQSGLVAYHAKLGDRVKTGDVIADLILLDGDKPARKRLPIKAGTDGIIFSMMASKYARPGTSIAKIAGKQKLASRGAYLLED